MSPEKYKYNDFISHDHENNKERQERRYNTEFPDHSNISDIDLKNNTVNEN